MEQPLNEYEELLMYPAPYTYRVKDSTGRDVLLVSGSSVSLYVNGCAHYLSFETLNFFKKNIDSISIT
jgi:hypothetical protein